MVALDRFAKRLDLFAKGSAIRDQLSARDRIADPF